MLKVGDQVKVKKFGKRPQYWGQRMDYLMGREVTIIGVEDSSDQYQVRDILDPDNYWWMELSDFDFSTSSEPQLTVIL
jgi:hypothetical protein